MCCAHIIEYLLDSESSVTVLRFVSNRQRRLKVLQLRSSQQVQLVCIDRHCASSVAVCGLPLRGRSAAWGRSSSPQLRGLERTGPASVECHLRSRSSRRAKSAISYSVGKTLKVEVGSGDTAAAPIWNGLTLGVAERSLLGTPGSKKARK
jgi:hypothetical protein